MYLLTFHAKPTRFKMKAENLGGAYINCWLEENAYENAERIAVAEIENAGWKIVELEEAYEISREDYDVDATGLEYYEQALIDKHVYVYHTYPLEN